MRKQPGKTALRAGATPDSEQITELPDRAALSLVNANLALPINAALSANVLSDGSAAYSNAQQVAPVNQGALSSPISL